MVFGYVSECVYGKSGVMRNKDEIEGCGIAMHACIA